MAKNKFRKKVRKPAIKGDNFEKTSNLKLREKRFDTHLWLIKYSFMAFRQSKYKYKHETDEVSVLSQ